MINYTRKHPPAGPRYGVEVRSINITGIRLLKEFEGLRLEAYKCPAGVWTIGYGHTRMAKEGMRVSPDVAEAYLHSDLSYVEKRLDKMFPRGLNENEFSALVCLCFNIGMGAFERSTLCKLLLEGKKDEASEQFLRWNKAGGKELAGLTRRRSAERDLFLKRMTKM